MDCNHDYKQNPQTAIDSGQFLLLDYVKYPYENIYTLKCKSCQKVYRVNDHQGYHYDYWSWNEINAENTEQLSNAVLADAEPELGSYRLMHEILDMDKVLVLNFPYSVNTEQIVIYFKTTGADDVLGELILDSESRKTISKLFFKVDEFYDRLKNASNRSSLPVKLLIDKNKFDKYYLDLFT